MKYGSRHEPMFLLPALLTLVAACNSASGDRYASDDTLFIEDETRPSTSSLDRRPLVILGFCQPVVGATVTTKGHQPLLDYLTSHTPYRFRVLFSTDSERQVGVLEERLVETALLDVVSYLEAHQQFGAVPLVKMLNRDGEPVSRSVFVAREGTSLDGLGDLRGHSLGLGAFHSTLSHLIPRHELLQAGVQLEELAGVEYFDDDEAIGNAVLGGRIDAGAVGDAVFYRLQEEGLAALHVSGPIPAPPLVIRDDLPPRVTRAIVEALLRLDFEQAQDRQHWAEEIRYGFAPATDSDYDPVRNIMKTVGAQCAATCHESL